MAEVHKLLSRTQWAPVNLSQLASHIIQMSLHTLPPDRAFEVQVTPSFITISPRQAGNLALILNELTTNTIQHATLTDNPQQPLPGQIDVRIAETEDTIKTLSGFIPLCAWCHRQVRGEAGAWISLETYIRQNSEAQITHSGPAEAFEQKVTVRRVVLSRLP